MLDAQGVNAAVDFIGATGGIITAAESYNLFCSIKLS
jgi:hypothetical protein